MRKIKQILTFILALCLCFGTAPINVMAADNSNCETVNYMDYTFPKNAEVLYQSENGIVYVTNAGTELTAQTRAMEYNQVWIDKGKIKSGVFTVKNPHPLNGDANGTLKLESEASNVKMDVVVSAGVQTVKTTTISANQEVHFSYNSFSSEIAVHYFVNKKSDAHGMRLNCWIW